MGSYEATNVVLARIRNLEPENATKIMGYLLMNLEENELVQLACSSDPVLHTLIFRVKTHLGFPSNSLSAPSISCSPSDIGIARPFNGLPFSQASPRMVNNPFDFTRNSVSSSSPGWPLSPFPNNPVSPKSSPSLTYQNICVGSTSVPCFSLHVNADCSTTGERVDEQQMNGYFSFLNEASKTEEVCPQQLQLDHGVHNWHSPSNGYAPFHSSSYSASEMCLGSEGGSGIGLRPCLYFYRGFCKNGSGCKFAHGGFGESLDASSGVTVGSPNKFDGFQQGEGEEFLRLKAAEQQKLAAMSPSSHEKHLHFLLQQQNDPQRATAAGLMMGEEFYRRCRQGQDFLATMSSEKPNSASRQIYLTFPAESTFRDEDVSEYFSKFGPVQDVRIPYQQKRMFGFVTFVFPETVKLILSKGNPHFICDCRVLVKPYKEKGKVPDKRQQQQHQLEIGDFSPCLSPLGFDSKEPYDVPFGPRMFYNPQEIFLRRKLEEEELQQAIELQGRRLKNLQLPDFRSSCINHHQRSLSIGAPFPSEQQLQSHSSNAVVNSDSIKEDITGNDGSLAFPTLRNAEKERPQQDVKPASINDEGSEIGKDGTNTELFGLPKCVEPVFPDSLFASPTEAAGEIPSEFSVLPEVPLCT